MFLFLPCLRQMADDLRLSSRALHLSFNYFDRFLSRMECEERNLQLVSTACMWVAAKVDAGTTVAASQLETLVGIENKHILEMERCLVCMHLIVSSRTDLVAVHTCSLARSHARSNPNAWRDSCLQLSVLRWQVQPVTTFDMARLLVPFMFCEREHRDKLEQVIENLTLAQALGTLLPRLSFLHNNNAPSGIWICMSSHNPADTHTWL